MFLTETASKLLELWLKRDQGGKAQASADAELRIEMEKLAIKRMELDLASKRLDLDLERARFEAEKWRWEQGHAKDEPRRKDAEGRVKDANKAVAEAERMKESVDVAIEIVKGVQEAGVVGDRDRLQEITTSLVRKGK